MNALDPYGPKPWQFYVFLPLGIMVVGFILGFVRAALDQRKPKPKPIDHHDSAWYWWTCVKCGKTERASLGGWPEGWLVVASSSSGPAANRGICTDCRDTYKLSIPPWPHMATKTPDPPPPAPRRSR